MEICNMLSVILDLKVFPAAFWKSLWSDSLISRHTQQKQAGQKEPSTQQEAHFYIWLLPSSTPRQRVEDPCTSQKVLDVPMMSLSQWGAFFRGNTLCFPLPDMCCPLCDAICVSSCPFSTWLPCWQRRQVGGWVSDSNKVHLLIFQCAQSFSGDENMVMN